MMCAWLSQECRGSRSFGWRGLKSGPAHAGASEDRALNFFGA
jgi:hypothetical protein